jgi:hypothetical protein
VHRRLIGLGLVLVLSVVFTDPARADGTGDAFNDGDEIGAGAQDGGSQAGGGGGGGGQSNPCRYELMDDRGQQAAQGLADGGWGDPAGDGPGAYYRRICDIGNGQTSATIVWLADPAVDPAVLAQEALDRTPIPVPEVRLNPPAGRDQVVNVPTWMWLDPGSWAPVSATASAGSVTVTATATPTSVSWDMGNGDVVVCAGPGTPYDPSKPSAEQHSDCTYTYRRSSAREADGAFTLTVTTTWGVSWTATGAAGGGSLGTASRTTTSPIRVAEIQAVNE